MMTDPTTAQGFLTTVGLFVTLAAVCRHGLLFLIDAYYDALARVRKREAGLPPQPAPARVLE